MNRKLVYKTLLVAVIIGTFVYFAFPLDKRINLGLDLKGGMHLRLKVDTSRLPDKEKADACNRALEIIRNRIDQFGVREPSIQQEGNDTIIVQLPGISDRDKAISLIGRTALLEFKLVSDNQADIEKAQAGNVPAGYELKYLPTEEKGKEPLLLEAVPSLTGEALIDAQVSQDESRLMAVAFELSPQGARRFAQLTGDNIGRRLAVVLDGAVQSAPVIQSKISNKGVITQRYGFNAEEAAELALVLRSGALPAPMRVEEERTVGPLLGQDSINKGVKASIVGISLVLIFMAIYYLLAGIVADIALLLNLLIVLGGLGMLPLLVPGVSATLTLPGIAGIALSLGMAIDANVLINERIREELASGKNLRAAIANGYERAFSAIFDSNLTTLIAAFLLFKFGTGPIRGFAVTLTIGLIASMFTAIVVTRTILELLLNFGLLKSFPMLRFIGKTKIDFIGKRKIFYAISLVVICAGLAVFFKKGPAVYGIDFVGGQIQEYSFKSPVEIDSVRTALKDTSLSDISIQQFKDDPKVILIKSPFKETDIITSTLKEKFPQQDVQVLKIERVGPAAGKYLKDKALWALIWSLVGILVYVAFRFKHFNFAFAGVIALFHDVLVALTALVITGRPIDLLSVTALLTIAGYSINDTIVIYDRVRENNRLLRKTSLAELINLSVNQTLSRTILTSGATLLVVLAIFMYGGEVLSNFAFTLIVGFIAGVYSTVFIASPLVLAWAGKRGRA